VRSLLNVGGVLRSVDLHRLPQTAPSRSGCAKPTWSLVKPQGCGGQRINARVTCIADEVGIELPSRRGPHRSGAECQRNRDVPGTQLQRWRGPLLALRSLWIAALFGAAASAASAPARETMFVASSGSYTWSRASTTIVTGPLQGEVVVDTNTGLVVTAGGFYFDEVFSFAGYDYTDEVLQLIAPQPVSSSSDHAFLMFSEDPSMWLADGGASIVGSFGFSPDCFCSFAAQGIFTPTTPLPAALPLFATGLGVIGLLARRRKRKGIAAQAAA
jgi:hypothetical protein